MGIRIVPDTIGTLTLNKDADTNYINITPSSEFADNTVITLDISSGYKYVKNSTSNCVIECATDTAFTVSVTILLPGQSTSLNTGAGLHYARAKYHGAVITPRTGYQLKCIHQGGQHDPQNISVQISGNNNQGNSDFRYRKDLHRQHCGRNECFGLGRTSIHHNRQQVYTKYVHEYSCACENKENGCDSRLDSNNSVVWRYSGCQDNSRNKCRDKLLSYDSGKQIFKQDSGGRSIFLKYTSRRVA